MRYNMCWDITSKCNDNCKFCYRDKISKDLPLNENKKILKNIYDSKVINKITICGGEPLMYDGLFELLDSIEKPKEVALSIVTNGIKLAKYDYNSKKFIIDKELVEKMISTFEWICFSIDSNNSRLESKVTRNPLHVKRIKVILKYINKNYPNAKIKINSLLSKQNYKNFESLHKFISSFSIIKRWKIFRYLGNSNTEDINMYFEIDNKKCNAIKEFISKVSTSDLEISINDIEDYDGSYIMLKQDGIIKVNTGSEFVDVLDLKKESISKYIELNEFNKDLHTQKHFVK